MNKFKKNVAFTLVELLITMSVIGVIAIIIFPILNSYKSQQFAVATKNVYSHFNQVLQSIAIDNGTPGSLSSFFGDTQTAGDTISSYFKVMKNCKMNVGQGCCVRFNDNHKGGAGTYYDRDNQAAYYKFVAVDGVAYVVESLSANCSYNRGFSASSSSSPIYNKTCGAVSIDVNGSLGPNILGRDVHFFYITSNKTPMLYPAGGFYQSNSNTGTMANGGSNYWNYLGTTNGCSSSNTNGWLCTGRMIDKGWIIDY